MTQLAKPYPGTPTTSIPSNLALQAIHNVLDQCQSSQHGEFAPAVAREIAALQELAALVRDQWPLSQETKALINLGPVAAKNIADWNPALADSLMTLDYGLRHDGELLSGLAYANPSTTVEQSLTA